MTRHKLSTLAVAAVSVAAIAAATLILRRPLLERWYIATLESGTDAEKEAAARNLARMRSVRGAHALARMLRPRLRVASPEDYCWRALVDTGEAGIPAVVELFEDADYDLRHAAFTLALSEGAAMTQHLGATLESVDPYCRRLAATVLRQLGPAAGSARLDMRRAVTDRVESVREEAVAALSETGSVEEMGAHEFLGALADSSPFVRARAATALGRLGRDGRPAVERLRDCLRDEVSIVRRAAVVALSEIDPVASLADLRAALDDTSPEVRFAAEEALGRLRFRALAEFQESK